MQLRTGPRIAPLGQDFLRAAANTIMRKRGLLMYQTMYTILFNAITDALESLRENDADAAMERLENAQAQAEEIYVTGEDGEA